MNVDINIDHYLSEEDKLELARDLFKEELRKGFIEEVKEKRIDNYERVITNAVFHFLHSEVDNILGTDHIHIIRKGVDKVLKKDLTYSVFRSPSLWGDKKSRAQEIMDEAVEANKELAYSKVKEALEKVDLEGLDGYLLGEVLTDIIKEKLKS